MQVEVKEGRIIQLDDGTLAVLVSCITTNSNYPDDKIGFTAAFAAAMTPEQIKSAIDNAVTLLWTTKSNPQWQVGT